MTTTSYSGQFIRSSLFERDSSGKILYDSTGRPIISRPWIAFIQQIITTQILSDELAVLQATTKQDQREEEQIGLLEAISQQVQAQPHDDLQQALNPVMNAAIGRIEELALLDLFAGHNGHQEPDINPLMQDSRRPFDPSELEVMLAMQPVLPDASRIQRGAMNTSEQSFAGDKHFYDRIRKYGAYGQYICVNQQSVIVPTVDDSTTLTAAALIPAGCMVLGVTVTVLETFGNDRGLSTFMVGDGSDVDRWASAVPRAAGPGTTMVDFTITSPIYYTVDTDVVFTADGANKFDTDGSARVTAFCISLGAATS